MRFVKSSLRPALALFVIAHGLAHTVLPMRMGGRPFTAVIRPFLVMILQCWGAFVLVPTDDGKTRFIIRTKIGDERTPVWAAVLDVMTFQLPHFIMERRMMLQIKSLSEATGARVS